MRGSVRTSTPASSWVIGWCFPAASQARNASPWVAGPIGATPTRSKPASRAMVLTCWVSCLRSVSTVDMAMAPPVCDVIKAGASIYKLRRALYDVPYSLPTACRHTVAYMRSWDDNSPDDLLTQDQAKGRPPPSCATKSWQPCTFCHTIPLHIGHTHYQGEGHHYGRIRLPQWRSAGQRRMARPAPERPTYQDHR